MKEENCAIYRVGVIWIIFLAVEWETGHLPVMESPILN